MSSWHLYLISSASVRSLLFLSFIVPILAWNVPMISPIFLKRTLSSVAQWCLVPCDPMDCSMPGLPFHHQLLEFTQTHVHWVGDAIQPSHPLSSPPPPSFNLSQHQGLFKWDSSSHQVAKVLEFQLQHQSFQWTHNKCCHTLYIFVQLINTLVWFPLAEKNSLAP